MKAAGTEANLGAAGHLSPQSKGKSHCTQPSSRAFPPHNCKCLLQTVEPPQALRDDRTPEERAWSSGQIPMFTQEAILQSRDKAGVKRAVEVRPACGWSGMQQETEQCTEGARAWRGQLK